MNEVKVYNPGTDELVDVTQEWVDDAQRNLNKLAKQREIVRKVLSLKINHHAELLDKLDHLLYEYKIRI